MGFEEDYNRECLENGEAIEAQYGAGWWSRQPEQQEQYRYVYKALDKYDMEWIYDPVRGKVYLVAAEAEMGSDNGYWVDSLQSATDMLNDATEMPEQWTWDIDY